MTGRRWITLLLAVCVLGGLTGCGSKPVVGVVLPKTGLTKAYGESVESGMRLAVSDAVEKQQLPSGFEVFWADSGSSPAEAAEATRQLIQDKGAKLILGAATSAEALAIIPVLEETNTICLSPSASMPGLTKSSKLFFRIYPSDELEGHTAGKFLIDRLSATEVVLFFGDSEYVRGIEPEFRRQYEENLGGKVVATVDLLSEDWQSAADKALREHETLAVYIIGYSDEIGEAVQYVRDAGFEGRIVTTSAFFTSQAISSLGDAADGVLFPLPPFDRTSEKEPVRGFVNRYMEAYERAPDVFAAHGYDAMMVAIQVLQIANPPETPEINKALHFGVTDFMGVTGPILFDDFGDVKHYPKMFIVKDGQVVSYRRYLDAERKRILRQVQNLLVTEG